jgi:hypothetical protein
MIEIAVKKKILCESEKQKNGKQKEEGDLKAIYEFLGTKRWG